MTFLAEKTMVQSAPSYLASLNAPQKEAVLATEGPLLVLAGAGTGKTKVLTTRIAHLIMQGLAYPSQILAVTFTNKAAREMTERIGHLVTEPVEGLWFGTFHSIAARMLRRHAPLVGLTASFTIIDTDDQIRVIKSILVSLSIDEKKHPAKSFLAVIQRWKDQGLTPAQVKSGSSATASGSQLAMQIYEAYQTQLHRLNAADFGDLLLHVITLFTSHSDILAEYQKRFRYLLVDEYQDTNIAQYLWLRLLAQGHKNICCVGDDDQSIYGWRGAEVGNILRFEHDFPGATVIRLEQNYRSTSHILGAASHLIANNQTRLGKTLWTDSAEGEKIRVIALLDDREEARTIAQEIESLTRHHGYTPDKVAILVRASFQTRAFEECFVNFAIPYRVVGGLRFYERQEIRDVIAYIRLSHQLDDDLALERIINKPKRSIGDATLQQIRLYAREHECSLFQAIRALLTTGELKRAKVSLQSFTDAILRFHALLDHSAHLEVVETILKESGYLAMWQQERTPEAEGRIENIKELLRSIEKFQSITEFLEHVSLVADVETTDTDKMVSIMTLHAAKGLEFAVVFLPGWEEGLFPHQRALEENGTAGLEEERRLAYVGLTRSRERAYVTYALNRRVYYQWQATAASRFVHELPELHCDTSATTRPRYRQESYSQEIETPKRERAVSQKPKPEKNTDPNALYPGDTVTHTQFGRGQVLTVNGPVIEVSFSGGRRKILSRFVEKIL